MVTHAFFILRPDIIQFGRVTSDVVRYERNGFHYGWARSYVVGNRNGTIALM